MDKENIPLTFKDNLKMAFDVSYLKGLIKTFDREFCPNSTINEKMHKEYIIPQRWYDDLEFICNGYGATFKIEVDDDAGGSYNKPNKTVCLRNDRGFVPSWDIVKIFSHELSHRIQHITWEHLEAEEVDNYFKNRFDRVLQYERIAERLAYFVAREYFQRMVDSFKLTHRSYTSYGSKSNADFLAEHHGFIKNDRGEYVSNDGNFWID